MIKLIVGVKGSGKTKTLIELANKAVETSPGSAGYPGNLPGMESH